jgi:selenocysteine-specific elongation factor
MPREELKSRLGVETRHYAPILARAEADGHLQASDASVQLPEHEIVLTDEQRRQVDALVRRYERSPFSPPGLSEAEDALGAELLQAVIDEGRLVKVSDGVLFAADAYGEMTRRLVRHLEAHQQASVAEVRDLFGTSRRYALALLEHTDRTRVTKRIGDVRVLR